MKTRSNPTKSHGPLIFCGTWDRGIFTNGELRTKFFTRSARNFVVASWRLTSSKMIAWYWPWCGAPENRPQWRRLAVELFKICLSVIIFVDIDVHYILWKYRRRQINFHEPYWSSPIPADRALMTFQNQFYGDWRSGSSCFPPPSSPHFH